MCSILVLGIVINCSFFVCFCLFRALFSCQRHGLVLVLVKWTLLGYSNVIYTMKDRTSSSFHRWLDRDHRVLVEMWLFRHALH